MLTKNIIWFLIWANLMMRHFPWLCHIKDTQNHWKHHSWTSDIFENLRPRIKTGPIAGGQTNINPIASSPEAAKNTIWAKMWNFEWHHKKYTNFNHIVMKFQGYKNPNQIQKKNWKNTYERTWVRTKSGMMMILEKMQKFLKQRRIVFKISNIIVLNQNNHTIGISSVIFWMTLF